MRLESLVRTVLFTGRRRIGVSCGVGVVLLAGLVVLVASLALASSPSFPDVSSSNPYYSAITDLAYRGIIGGYANGTFGPNDPVSRQQFAKMIVKTLGLTVTGTETCPFTDVQAQSGSDPFYPSKYVAVCASQGITSGKTATSFDPTGDVTRQQLITMVARAAALSEPPDGYAPDFFPGQFATTDHFLNARKAAHAGLLSGLQGVGPTYNFAASASRGECAQLLYNLLQHTGGSTTTSGVSTTTSAQAKLFKHIRTVQVTEDHFHNGVGSDIVYIPATDRIAVIMGGELDQPITLPTSEVCTDKVVGYEEYTTDMQPTGKYGYLSCGFSDVHARAVGNDVYIAKMRKGGPGYTLEKYDGSTWQRLASRDVVIDDEKEYGNGGGPDSSYINGQFVVTGEYLPGGKLVGGTHNMIFTTDLAPVKTVLLYPPDVPEHHAEYSLLQRSNGDILLFGSAGPSKGDLEVLRFDKDWHFLEQKWLLDHAYYPTASATDGRYTYVGYMDWSRTDSQAGQNAHLAAFDAQWNLVEDVALSDVQSVSNLSYAEQTSIVLHGNRIYLFYVVHTLNPDTGTPDPSKAVSYVDVFEVGQGQ
jgi:hypothetical protein